MWNNYFYQIRKKYSMRVSQKKPLVINLDGKNVTGNKSINIIESYEGSFLSSLEKSAQYFTEKYKCLSIFGADEISFIFEEPMDLINDLNTDKNTYQSEIISVFSQYFYDYFNKFDLHKKVFWHGKCYSINKEKINSYIKYKSKLIQVLVTTYFLKTKGVVDAGKLPLNYKKTKCREYNDYKRLDNIERGILYYKGKRIDLDEFLNGNIKEMDNLNREIISDLFNF